MRPRADSILFEQPFDVAASKRAPMRLGQPVPPARTESPARPVIVRMVSWATETEQRHTSVNTISKMDEALGRRGRLRRLAKPRLPFRPVATFRRADS